nr:MAG TPA: hypothetical protein [Caudoviricetes sp.]
MVRASQITVYGLGLINAMLAKRPYVVYDNTTLNEKHNVLPTRHMVANHKHPEYPILRYFAIGIGGIPIIEDVNQYRYSQHSPLDAALFKQIPFAIKPVDNDFLPSERDKYRIRVPMDIRGEKYWAYYLKTTTSVDYRGYSYIVRKVNGEDVLSMLDINTDKFLNPEPSFKPLSKEDMLTAPTVINRFKLELELDERDQLELQNVLHLLDLPVTTKITEIGVCFGHNVLTNDGYELIDAQIAYHIDVDLDVSVTFDARIPFKENIELGGAEPLWISKVN